MDFRLGHMMSAETNARLRGYSGASFGADVILAGIDITQLLAQYNSYTPAQKSDYWVAHAALGKWLTFSNGGAQPAADPRMSRNADGTWVWWNGSQLGYATGVIDAPKHGVAGFVQGVENDVSNAYKVVTEVFGQLIDIITTLVSEFGGVIDGLLELAEFISSIAGDLLALVDPTGTAASRQNALNRLNPLHKGGAVYNFIVGDGKNGTPDYTKSRNLLAIILVAPLALFAYAIMEILLGHISPQLAQVMSPGNLVDAAMAALGAIVEGLANGQNVFVIVQGVINGLLSAYGIQASPACIVKIAYMVILGLPIPPVSNILVTLLADPVAQQSLAHLVDVSAVAKILPVAVSCFDAADATSWLNCFESLIHAFFPGIITDLANLSVDLHDLRVLVQGAWQTGGNLPLMFQSAALNAPEGLKFGAFQSGKTAFAGVSFGAASASLSPMQAAAIGIGFFGVGLIANKLGWSVASADNAFETVVLPLLPSNIQAEVRDALDVYAFMEQLLIDGGSIKSPISVASPPSIGSFALYLLESFHTNKWDVEATIFSVISDELAPGSSVRFFSSNVKKTQGVVVVTPALKGLFTKLMTDFPKLGFALNALAQQLGVSDFNSLIGTSTDTTQTARGSGNSKPVVSTNTPVVIAKPAYNLPIAISTPTGGAVVNLPSGNGNGLTSGSGSGSGSGSNTTATPSGINWGTLAAGAGAGALFGGPAGALLGAAAGALFPGKK